MKGPIPYKNVVNPYTYERNYRAPYHQPYHAPYQANLPGPQQPYMPVQPYSPYYQQNGIPQQMAHAYPQQGYGYSSGTSPQQQVFQNPLQAEDYANKNYTNGNQHHSNPYPKSSFHPKPPPGGVHTLMNSFKSQDGSIDLNKMVNTAGQMMNAVNQVSSMVKGLGGFFKA